MLMLAGALAVPAAPSCASRTAVAESGRPATDADDPGNYPDTGPAPRLTGAHSCSGHPGFTCSTLAVPLDHKGRHPGSLELQVATSDNDDAPKGVLLFLTGGPGQPGVPSVTHVSERLSRLMRDYRLVMIDQRGTGEFGAVDCPKLQEQVGGSDAAVATPDAVAECAGVLGARRDFFSTDQTVGDLESLRRALGVSAMTVDGVSYGSFTAARYAVAHPSAVSRLVLDSVLPHVDPQHDDSLELVALRATTRVLRDACSVAPACGYDPADDLAWVVRHRTDPVSVFDALVGYEFSDPTYRDPNPYDLPSGHGDFIGALHAARNGDSSRLDTLLADEKPGGDDRTSLSSGLHIATVCSDPRFPWGDSRTPVARRQAGLDRVEHRLTTADVWPFTPETAVGQGLVQQCLRWPPVRPASEPRTRMLPAVPTLILAGDRDLSTPLEWAQEEARYAPEGRLVVVKGAAHSIQNREDGTQGRAAVYAFLEGEDG